MSDGVGNVTSDGSNTYSYNAEGHPVKMNNGAQTIIYDAFDRPVEINNGGSYTQIVYAPDGYKFAMMNSSTVIKYTAPLAAGLQAVYTGSGVNGLAYWRHADWLGSSRIASKPDRTVQYDLAYAPYGETYAEMGTQDRSFTGQTQDVIAGSQGIYDFLYRQNASSQGRWLVPDPAKLAAVDLANPQTWNRYAYVANNPMSNVDRLGLEVVPCTDGSDAGTICFNHNDNSDAAQPPPKSDNPGGNPQNVLSWNFGPAPGQPGKLPPNYFRNGNWKCTTGVNSSWQCTGAAANGGDVSTPGIEGLFHAPGRAQLWANASGAANTLLVATVVVAAPAVGEGAVVDYSAQVIGRLPETTAWVAPFSRVISQVGWDPTVNAAWISAGIARGTTFILASPMTESNLLNPNSASGLTAFGEEVLQILGSGYVQSSNVLIHH